MQRHRTRGAPPPHTQGPKNAQNSSQKPVLGTRPPKARLRQGTFEKPRVLGCFVGISAVWGCGIPRVHHLPCSSPKPLDFLGKMSKFEAQSAIIVRKCHKDQMVPFSHMYGGSENPTTLPQAPSWMGEIAG